MRQLASIFFSLLFLVFLATPTYVDFFDDSIDISYIHTSTENEKNNSERVIGEIENKLFEKLISYNFCPNILSKKHVLGLSKSIWETLYYDINSPPPEIA